LEWTFSRLPIALKSFIFSMAIDTSPSTGPLPVKSLGRHTNHHLSWRSHHCLSGRTAHGVATPAAGNAGKRTQETSFEKLSPQHKTLLAGAVAGKNEKMGQSNLASAV